MKSHRTEYFSSSQLKRFCSAVLQKVEIPPAEGDLIAESLVQANLWGVDSHGVTKMAIYVKRLSKRLVNPNPRINILRETPAMAVVDGDNGAGQVVGARAMELAIAKARESGVGLVGIRNSNHFGAAAFFTMMPLRKEMIGVALSNASATMVPWGGRSFYLGTNPISVAVPAGQELPIVLDMATSVVSRGKIILAAQQGESIPAGWAIDSDGEVTTDAARALDGCVLPFGGPKGSAISLLIDVLAGVLTGAAFGPHIGDLYRNMERPQCVGHMMGAIDISWFSDVGVFKNRIDQMIREIKSVSPAKGMSEVLLPGEIEARIQQQREVTGIPLTPDVINDLYRLGLEYEVPWCGTHPPPTES